MKDFKILIICLILFPGTIFAQDWTVPSERGSRLAPFAFSELSEAAGENIFNLNCKSCHGNPGQGNFQLLNPIPGDPAESKFQINTDGAMQYKISEGHGLMPSFKNVLSAGDIWNVISYIRSFNSDYVQSVAQLQQLKDMKWSEIKIGLSLSETGKQIIATLLGLEGEDWTPVPNTEVKLSAIRYFGKLTLDEPKITDDKGVANFGFPDDLPAERDGKVRISAILTNQDLFGTISKDTTLTIGAANLAPSLTAERAMWNIGKKAPVWLMITYPAGVFLVWGFIFYVLFQLRTVYNEGNEEDEL